MTKEQRKRSIAWLTHMRTESAKIAHLDPNSGETRANYNALIAILSDESEADRRLGAAMPSVSAVRLVRCWYDNAVHALASVGHLMDDRRDVNEQLSELSEWLQRVEAAKNGGDHG